MEPMSNNSSSNKSSPSERLQPENWRYESAVAEIETIIGKIESGDLDLEEVFGQFAQAVESLQQCESFLTQRQSQIDLLIETLGDPPNP
jgi:exodeoxyribonuclease VII small subunit